MGSPQENPGGGSGSGTRLQNPFRNDETALNETGRGQGPGAGGLMRRGNSDGYVLPQGPHNPHSQVPDHAGETWMDFLRHPQNNGQDATGRERVEAHRAALMNADRMRRLHERRDGRGRTRSATANPQLGGDRNAQQNLVPLSPDNPFYDQLRPPGFLFGGPPNRSVPPPASSPTQRPTGDIVLPRWQPDSEVSECPICHRTFSMFFRKHHCRKCGRVVCGSCSPHRITIPRQFIVHPPQDLTAGLINAGRSPTDAIDLTGEDDATSRAASNSRSAGQFTPSLDPALGGGQEVRLCNPCVPDPNPSPPPPYTPSSPHNFAPFPTYPDHPTARAHLEAQPYNFPHLQNLRPPPQPPPPPREPSYRRQTLPSGPVMQPPSQNPMRNPMQTPMRNSMQNPMYPDRLPRHGPERRSSSGSHRSPVDYQRNSFSGPHPPRHQPPNLNNPLPPHPGQHYNPMYPGSVPSASSMHDRYIPNFRPGSHHPPHSQHRASASTSQIPPRTGERGPRSMLDVSAPFPPTPQLREEDECPICHLALPDGGEAVREAHVQRCIEEHFSSSGPTRPSAEVAAVQAAVAAATSPATAGQASSGAVSGNHGNGGGAAGGEHRARAESSTTTTTTTTRAPRRPAGMLVYHASEKDCVGQDGEDAQECVICFEEFQVGVEMGRLECLCKFHRECIRQWWDTKGLGACPVHQGGLN